MDRHDYLGLLESCYHRSTNTEGWLADVAQALVPVLDGGLGLGVSYIRDAADKRLFVHNETRGRLASNASFDDTMSYVGGGMDRESFQCMYYARRSVLRSGPLASRMSSEAQAQYAQAIRGFGAADCMGMMAYPAPGIVLAIIAPMRAGDSLSRRRADALHQLLLHIEAGFRLRQEPPLPIAAVLSASGKLLHATGEARLLHHQAALSRQARWMEATRAASRRRWGEETLAAWQALVAGRWTLAERIERGQRQYVAFENPPNTWRQRALHPTEARVITLTSRGLLGKQVATELGISEPRTAECLQSAAMKLGLRSKLDMLQLAAELAGGSPAANFSRLTAAEREVLQHLAQGKTDQQIARDLGKSRPTVSHQVSSLLAKTGCTSRRALALAGLCATDS